MTQIWTQLFRYWFVALFPNSNARSNSTDIWNEIFTKKKKKLPLETVFNAINAIVPISCARNIWAMSSNIWLFCLEILLGLTVKRDGWSVYQWLLYSPENQTPHSRQCSQLIFASALMKSSNFWITFCTKWS